MDSSKKLGIEIKEDINEQAKIKVYKNNLLALKELVDLSNIQPIYCNTTNTIIQHNSYITYVSKSVYFNSLKSSMLLGKGNELVIGYNTNNVRQPEIEYLTIIPLVTIELEKGYLFITKLLDDVKML